ncbi:MAG: ABC transporter ATP-binding protein [Alphaproteobacteria bacterium]|nr:ABC transporter ATP-binding protein [Alphaproteobacteria bacterium]MCB9698398.1 ABC transporter ATP-binding protein [Alphaproteobacteria bacterium]
MGERLLEVRGLQTHFHVEKVIARAVAGVDFHVDAGEFLGIVGESGSGKSVTALSVLRLIPDPPGRIAAGEVLFKGRDLLKLSWEEIRAIRGRDIAMIFQEPMTSLNPVFTIGMQVAESVQHHEKLDKAQARERAVQVLEAVGIPAARKRLDDYPHQFSGGMRQRVMIAMALICNPSLLIADEPTTALDVTIQAQILDLMQDLQQKHGTAVMLITHSLAVVAETCQRVLVMYGGRIQEEATVTDLFDQPLHPYTRGLLDSIPDRAVRGQPMRAIPGNVPSIFDFPSGCRFRTRCPIAKERCAAEEPELVDHGGRKVRCHFPGEVA